jgi:hypothetical protein
MKWVTHVHWKPMNWQNPIGRKNQTLHCLFEQRLLGIGGIEQAQRYVKVQNAWLRLFHHGICGICLARNNK